LAYIRYKPNGNYFGRVRVNGKLIRRSLKTHVLSVAKLKLSDFLQDNRRLAINKGEPVKGEVIIEMFRKEIEDDHTLNGSVLDIGNSFPFRLSPKIQQMIDVTRRAHLQSLCYPFHRPEC